MRNFRKRQARRKKLRNQLNRSLEHLESRQLLAVVGLNLTSNTGVDFIDGPEIYGVPAIVGISAPLTGGFSLFGELATEIVDFRTLQDWLVDGGMQWSVTSIVVLDAAIGYEIDADSLGEDLVFQAAVPITGGREVHGGDGQIERGATEASFNNFQARYIIRHRWQGPVECENPVYGRWGGPPAGV